MRKTRYADKVSVKSVKNMKAQPGARKEVRHEIHHDIKKSFRIQGIREDPEKSKSKNFVPTTEKVHEVLNKLGFKPQIEDIKKAREIQQRAHQVKNFKNNSVNGT